MYDRHEAPDAHDRSGVVVFAVLFVGLISDGFDLQALGFAAPAMVREWGIARAALAPALSAGLVGVFAGAPLFGWLGDRWGRRRAVMLASTVYGLFCLATIAAGSVAALAALRFGTGLGLGGVLPNIIALAAERAPIRHRTLFTSLITVGISTGGLVAGGIAASLVPGHGWRILFAIGGVLPFVTALLIRLVLHDGARPTLAHPSPAPPNDPRLFTDRFARITPLLWLLFAGVLMSIYLLTSWLPLALETGGMPARSAALMNMMLQFGGIVGGIGASLLLPRLGSWLVIALLVAALAVLAILAATPLPPVWLAAALGLCGVGLIGCQTAINALAALIYPTPIRARGVGFALGIGRLGSIVGPIVGAAFLATGGQGSIALFTAPLLPLAAALVAALLLARRLAPLA